MGAMRRVAIALVAIIFLSACAHELPVTAPADSADVLNFIVGDSTAWPRIGTQAQDQQVDLNRREVCWTKYRRSDAFECWRWDDQWIYHEIDHALDGDRTGASYHFTDGRWLPRRLPVGKTWSMDLTKNHIIRVKGTCVAGPAMLFPYRISARFESEQVISADLGTRAILVLEYAPHATGAAAAQPETFKFARGAGWFSWSSARGTARFDRLGGPHVTRGASCEED